MTGGRLEGWTVLVTRQPEQSGALCDALVHEGATVVEVPLIETAPPEDPRPLADAVARLAEYDWIAFTSANAVRAVASALGERALPKGLRVATVGPATARAVSRSLGGRTPSLTTATDARATGLVTAFAREGVSGRRVLLPVSAIARDMLAVGLSGLGARVEVVTAYRTVRTAGAAEALARARERRLDLVTLASPSTVEAFVAAWPEGVERPPAVAIGPVTEKAARGAGLDVVGVASEPGPQAIVDVLLGLTRRR